MTWEMMRYREKNETKILSSLAAPTTAITVAVVVVVVVYRVAEIRKNAKQNTRIHNGTLSTTIHIVRTLQVERQPERIM